MATSVNETPFQYGSTNGTCFHCDRSDLSGGVIVNTPKDLSRTRQMQDVMEMAAYHATEIMPKLNGFNGYDTLKFVFTER